ncbi:hypothetical protein [Salininema proteolyticum]|uniref:Uncharacterized protein n=1 Tax=Salininema proteolyticum TaxID=1607685 RepID=A0ABV8TXH1_9ACTN
MSYPPQPQYHAPQQQPGPYGAFQPGYGGMQPGPVSKPGSFTAGVIMAWIGVIAMIAAIVRYSMDYSEYPGGIPKALEFLLEVAPEFAYRYIGMAALGLLCLLAVFGLSASKSWGRTFLLILALPAVGVFGWELYSIVDALQTVGPAPGVDENALYLSAGLAGAVVLTMLLAFFLTIGSRSRDWVRRPGQ